MSEALFGRRVGAAAAYVTLKPKEGYVSQVPAGTTILEVELPVNGPGLGYTTPTYQVRPDVTLAADGVTPVTGASPVQSLDTSRSTATTLWFFLSGAGGSISFYWQDVVLIEGGSKQYKDSYCELGIPASISSGSTPGPVLSGGASPIKLVPITLGGAVATSSGKLVPVVSGLLDGVPSKFGGGAGINAPLQLQQGQRYSITIKSSGQLPSGYPTTVSDLQAQLNAAGIQSTVVSVKPSSDGTTLFVEFDHCGPTSSIANPTVASDGSVTITSTYQVMGAATACTAPGWSPTKKAVVFGGGAAAVLVVAAGATKAAGWW